MTDIPIIFSGLMVKALLAGHKTMTRRLATRIKIVTNPKNGHFVRTETAPTTWQNVKPGDRLWVRENLDRAQGNFLGIKQNVFEAIYAADKAEVLNEDEFNLLPWWKGKGGFIQTKPRHSRARLSASIKSTAGIHGVTILPGLATSRSNAQPSALKTCGGVYHSSVAPTHCS